MKTVICSWTPLALLFAAPCLLPSQITLTPMTVAAGSEVRISIDFGVNAICSRTVSVRFDPVIEFVPPPGAKPAGFSFELEVKEGLATASAVEQVPVDSAFGDYQISVQPVDCIDDQYARGFTVRHHFLTVLPGEGARTKSPEVSAQFAAFREFLNNQADIFTDLNKNLIFRFNSTPSAKRRELLITTVETGLKDLDAAQSGYSERLRQRAKIPAFFDDFRNQLISLQQALAASPGSHSQAYERSTPSYVPIRYASAAPSGSPASAGAFSGALSKLAGNLSSLLKKLAAACKYVGETNRVTYSVSLSSSPPGARVSHKRIVDDDASYIPVGTPTSEVGASTPTEEQIDLARTCFRFVREKCETRIYGMVDPFERDLSKPVAINEVFHRCDESNANRESEIDTEDASKECRPK